VPLANPCVSHRSVRPSTVTGELRPGTSRTEPPHGRPAGRDCFVAPCLTLIRVWGPSPGSVALMVAVFEIAAVAGIPLALGDDFLTLLVDLRCSSRVRRNDRGSCSPVPCCSCSVFVVASFSRRPWNFSAGLWRLCDSSPELVCRDGDAFGGPGGHPRCGIVACSGRGLKTPRESGPPRELRRRSRLGASPGGVVLALGCLVWSINLAFGIEDSPHSVRSDRPVRRSAASCLRRESSQQFPGRDLLSIGLALLAVAGVTIGLSFARILAVVVFLSIVHFVPDWRPPTYGTASNSDSASGRGSLPWSPSRHWEWARS